MKKIIDIYYEYIGDNKILEAINLMLEALRHRDEELFLEFLVTKNQYQEFLGKKSRLAPEVYQEEHRKIVKLLLMGFKDAKEYHPELAEELAADPQVASFVQSAQQGMQKIKAMDLPEYAGPQLSDHTPIIAAVYTNAHATISNDLDLIRYTTHPENPAFEQNLASHQEIFQKFPNLQYRIMDIEMVHHEPNYAVVRVTQQTLGRHIYPDFTDNQTVLLHTLALDNGVWKLYGTGLSEVTYWTRPILGKED